MDPATALLRFFKSLADESRLKIVGLLAAAEHNVQDLAKLLKLKEPTVSHHLRILAETGFVFSERRGNTRLYRVNERCLEHFPSAAELIMGVLPRYQPQGRDCVAPWVAEEATAAAGNGRGRTRRRAGRG